LEINIKKYQVKTGPSSGSLTMGVDDIKVAQGKCAKA
jgi:hypothetical protein